MAEKHVMLMLEGLSISGFIMMLITRMGFQFQTSESLFSVNLISKITVSCLKIQDSYLQKEFRLTFN